MSVWLGLDSMRRPRFLGIATFIPNWNIACRSGEEAFPLQPHREIRGKQKVTTGEKRRIPKILPAVKNRSKQLLWAERAKQWKRSPTWVVLSWGLSCKGAASELSLLLTTLLLVTPGKTHWLTKLDTGTVLTLVCRLGSKSKLYIVILYTQSTSLTFITTC